MSNKKKKVFRKKKKIRTNSFASKRPIIVCDKRHGSSITKFKKRTYYERLLNFSVNFKRIKDMYKHSQSSTGLTPKEKSYVIARCQSKASRYLMLKNQAARAISENRIFTIYGSCKAVKNALTERGWVEKIPENKMNLDKIRDGTISDKTEIQQEIERLLLSCLVEKHDAHFVWGTLINRDTTIDMEEVNDNNTITNKIENDAKWTSKQGLCSLTKEGYWFYIENVADVMSPRTYNSDDCSDLEVFTKDFYITACTSLLKWILCNSANNKPIFKETGTISVKVVTFALNRCKEYLCRKYHKDIDCNLNNVSVKQWNIFMKKYYRVVAKGAIFRADENYDLPSYTNCARYILGKMKKHRLQLTCEGFYNIWIIKPGHCSRGRGIRMATDLVTITTILSNSISKFVIQKYIEEPLLVYDTKFDIRQYYLVTSTYPLVIWMYKDCYLKFSSQKYNLKNYHESIHLTNNAIQRKYKNCLERHTDLPQSNMWELKTYIDYLKSFGSENFWDSVTYPGMKKSIIGIMLSCQESLSVSKNRFELYGCDFILDQLHRPWLIEINACPDLKSTTPVTTKICPAVVDDIIKVIKDHAENPKAPTGNFECIYRQPITAPRCAIGADIVVQGHAIPLDYFRKTVKVKENVENPIVEKSNEITAIFKELQQYINTEETEDFSHTSESIILPEELY